MKSIKLNSFVVLILFASFNLIQAQSIDSLKQALLNEKQDTAKIKILSQLSELCEIEEILIYAQPLEVLTEKNFRNTKKGSYAYTFYLKHYADALGNIGFYYKHHGDVIKAMTYYNKSLVLTELARDTSGMAMTMNNIAMLYTNLGDIAKALEYFNRSLSAYESVKDKKGMAIAFNNIAGIYENQGDFSQAMEFYNKSLVLRESIPDIQGIATTLNNLGSLALRKGDTASALSYCLKFLKTNTDIGNKRGIAFAFNNIGFIYFNQGHIQEALDNYNKSLTIREELADKQGIALSLNNLARVFLKQGNYARAINYAARALELGRELGYPEVIREAALNLKNSYIHSNEPEKAIEMYDVYIQMRDSINNEQTRKSSLKSQLNYEFNKKEAVLKEQQEKERLLAAANHQRQNVIIASVIIGFLMVLFFSILIYNRLQLTRRQKSIIEEQKLLVEEHRKEIMDSINYAKRIQYALLASTTLLEKNLPQHFVLFKPKSVVSGDFYWGTLVEDGFIYVTADCTGHGVPGAFMSLLNISKLNQTINEKKITQPDLILNHVRTEIIKALNPDGSIEEGKDGMDAVICKLNHKKMRLEYAAANNAFYLVRKGELIVCPADKMPVGAGHTNSLPFKHQEIALQKGDMIYTFTDGYADQFGGIKGKKFKYKALEELMLQIAEEDLTQQKTILESSFESWKASNEQVDDVCIIGVRV